MSQPTTTTPALPVKEIAFDRESRDFALRLDGKLVGWARTYIDGERTLDAIVYERLKAAQADAAAAGPSEPAAVEVYQVGATAAYEVTVAGHRYHLHNACELGISWMGGDGPRISASQYDALCALWLRLFAPAAQVATPTRPADIGDAAAAGAEGLALAEQLVGELNQVERQAEQAGAEKRDELAAVLWEAYDSLSARIRRLGYDIGPGDGTLILYDVTTGLPLRREQATWLTAA